MSSYRNTFIRAYKLFDLLILVLSFGLAAWVSFYLQNEKISLGDFLAMRIKVQNFVLFLCLLVAWHCIFSFFALYASRRLSDLFDHNQSHTKASFLGGEPVISHYMGEMHGAQVSVKRILDALLSAVFMLAFSPVFRVSRGRTKVLG